MISDPMTLYKLMVLYMLRRVNFPLTEERITHFFLDREYTNYFSLKQALSELIESKFIRCHSVRNSTRYTITPEGEEAWGFFGKKVSSEILADIDGYLKENRFRIRSEVGVTADYYKSTNQDYIVSCEINEGRVKLISLSLSVPDEAQAELMCARWRDTSQDVYSYVLKKLMGGE